MKPLGYRPFLRARRLDGKVCSPKAMTWLVLMTEQHQYGEMCYPAQLVVQDVLTLHGSQFRNVDLIVASPPCQEYS